MEEPGRCSALCQHPGCWYAGTKQFKVLNKRHSEYAHYLDEIRHHHRKLIQDQREVSQTGGACVHSKTVDGLPTLKVQTLLHDGICEHKRCSTHPIPTKFCRTSSRHIRESRKRGLSKVNYAQMLLEEAADEHYESQNDVTFKPVLVWKPHQKSSPPRGDVCKQHVQPSDTFSGQSTVGVNADASKCNNDVYEEAKQSLTVFKTDLTDMLPPRRKGQKNKLSTISKHSGHTTSSNDLSLAYLGDIDLPPQIMDEILQHLRSESTSNHLSKTSSTHKHASFRQSLSGLHVANASNYLSYALSNRRVHNLSASELAKAARRRSPATTSFSRGLSKHPVDVLKYQQKEKLLSYLMNQKDEMENQGFDGDVSSRLMKPQVDPSPLHASGHTSCFHTRSSNQASHPKQHPPLNLQVPSSTSAAAESTHEIRISVPHETSLDTRPSPRTVTLTFDQESHHFSPRRNIEPKPSRRLTRVSKSQRFSSPRFFCEESVSCDEIQLVAHKAVQPSVFKTDNSSQFTELNCPPSLSFLRLTSQSPDYMSVGAKFSEGHLILTDREGLVTQHLHTEIESETNLNTQTIPEDENAPSGPVVEGDSSGSGLGADLASSPPPPGHGRPGDEASASAEYSTVDSREDLKEAVPDLNEGDVDGVLTSREDLTVQVNQKEPVPTGSRAPPPSAAMEAIRKDF